MRPINTDNSIMPPEMKEIIVDAAINAAESGVLPESPACDEEKLFLLAEAAPLLDLSRQTLYNWCKAQRIPSTTVGNAIAIRESVVQTVKALIDAYGSQWHRHASWNPEPTDPETEPESSTEVSSEPCTFADRVKRRAIELRDMGDTAGALELSMIIVEHFDFSEPA